LLFINRYDIKIKEKVYLIDKRKKEKTNEK